MPGCVLEPILIDYVAALDRVGGDRSLLNEITGIFLEEYPVLLEQIRQAVRDQNGDRLQRSAHSLKGSVANFGAAEVVSAAYRVERLGRSGQLSEAREAVADLETELQRLEPALKAIFEQTS